MIFSGIAGAIDSTVRIGDIVVCQRWISHGYVYHGAVCVSGNAFIDNVKNRIWLAETFGDLVTDMETAAVAQVC